MKGGWPGAMARKIGLSGEIDFTVSRIGMTLHVPCRRGDHVVDVTVAPGQHPNGIAKKMLGMGWTIGHEPICPEHSTRSRTKRIEEKEPPMATASPANGSEEPQRSPAAGKMLRLVMQHLEEYYDETKTAYRTGWTDARIAAETSASETFVKKTREESFGPLGIPPELDACRSEVRALEASILASRKQQDEQIAAAKRRIGEICRINGWPVE